MTRHSLLASVALSLLLGATVPILVETGPPKATASYVKAPNAYAFLLGDIEIAALSDGTVPQDLRELLTGTSRSEVDDLPDRSFLANPVETSINVPPPNN